MPPRIEAVLARLRELPIDAPPALTITDFERRAQRRRSRRRARRVGASLALLVLAAGALVIGELQGGEAELATVTRASPEEAPSGAQSPEEAPSGTQQSAPALQVEFIEGGLAINGYGFAPQTDVSIRQCHADTEDRCDLARGVVAKANGDGEVQIELHVYTEIFLGREWVRCEPCELRAQDAAGAVVASAGPWPGVERDGRPSVAIADDGPYSPGGLVTLTGAGYQMNAENVAFPWCQPAPGEDWLECVYVSSSRVTVDEGGGFEARGFALPDEDYFRDSSSLEVVLAWVPAVGAAPVAAMALRLSGDNLQATETR